METGFIDLHVHSTCSDGTFTPSELVHEAMRHSIRAFALTDHDCIDGIKEAQEEALQLNSPDAPEVIAGVELSCELNGREIHMVGLYINPEDKELSDKLNAFRSSRKDRNRLMVEKLQQEAHLAIDYDSLIKEFPDARGLQPYDLFGKQFVSVSHGVIICLSSSLVSPITVP